MWVSLPSWLVNDGEVPEPVSGSVLRATGLIAHCLEVVVCDAPADARMAAAGDGPASHPAPRYVVTGVAGPPRTVLADFGAGEVAAGEEFWLSAGQFSAIAQTVGCHTSHTDGETVRVRCWFSIPARYEVEACGQPVDVKDWVVDAVETNFVTIQPVPGATVEIGPGGITTHRPTRRKLARPKSEWPRARARSYTRSGTPPSVNGDVKLLTDYLLDLRPLGGTRP